MAVKKKAKKSTKLASGNFGRGKAPIKPARKKPSAKRVV